MKPLPHPAYLGSGASGEAVPWTLKCLQQFAEPPSEELRPTQGQVGRAKLVQHALQGIDDYTSFV